MQQVGVEGDRVARLQLVALAAEHESERPIEHDCRLAAPGLVQRRIAGAARGRARPQRVPGHRVALPGQRRRELGGGIERGIEVLGRQPGAPPKGCSITADALLNAGS